MTGPSSAIPFPRFGDVAHLGHVELFTPRPDESLAFFTAVVGLHESGRLGDSVYLRGWGEYEWHTLKLTAHATSGIGHMGLRWCAPSRATKRCRVASSRTHPRAGRLVHPPLLPRAAWTAADRTDRLRRWDGDGRVALGDEQIV
jgi:catechol 2,3-dioxygenase-like lactoylglutathione lyase family enzyme